MYRISAPSTARCVSYNGPSHIARRAVNPDLDRLQPYPFEKLRHLFAGIVPPAGLAEIKLSIGEPQHATPPFIQRALAERLSGLANYPTTQGGDELRQAIGSNPNRPIFIYCNNNFSDNRYPVVTKRLELALNIPTFVNLHGYGYHNVWELADVVKATDLGRDWVGAGTR